MGVLTAEPEVERVVLEEKEFSDDAPDAAHYVMSPNPEETNHAYVMRARIEGFPVTALCGFTWVPHREASSLPVCRKCEEISRLFPEGDGGDPRE